MFITGKSLTKICFKKWSRKRCSILISLNKVIKIGVLCLTYSLVNKTPEIAAQTDSTTSSVKSLEINEVEVIGRRSQAVFSEISRIVTVIQRDEIDQAGIQSIADLLEYASNLDIRQRGNAGVQADVNIRGGSFDHVMILVNGINLSDPQTGHFSLDLPVDNEAIEKIEILEGPAARVLGPGAFMGAINIITRNGGKNHLNASQAIGKFGYTRYSISTGIKTGQWQNFLSASKSLCEGFTDNTDFHIKNFYYRGSLNKKMTMVDIQGGYQNKAFGAGGFYSPRFPDQYEETDMGFASLKVTTGHVIRVTPSVYWRRKKDHFTLMRYNPGLYENYHLTDIYGSQVNLSYSTRHYTAAFGVDFRSENIYSNNIGFAYPDPKPVRGTDSAFYTKQYRRTNFGIFHEEDLRWGKFGLTAGAMVNWNTGYKGKPAIFPGIDISYRILKALTLYSSVNRAFHLPTFTDLFYTDPVNQGNIHLKPNRMISYEGGAKYDNKPVLFTLTGFYNYGRDIIDWVWSYTNNRFSSVNLSEYQTWGVSSNFAVDYSGHTRSGSLKTVMINYTYLDIKKAIPDSVSKFYNLKHKLSLSISQNLAKNLTLSLNICFQDREGETMGYQKEKDKYFSVPNKPFWLINGAMKWSVSKMQLFIEVSNILNTRYIDAGSALQPGRWLKAGLVVRFQP
jgi:vitamin B12 transporter